MAVHPLVQNFAAGYRLGNLMDERSEEREAGRALADLYTGQGGVTQPPPPETAPTDGAPTMQPPGMGPGSEGPFGEEKSAESISGQPGKLPSSRDWLGFTTEALRSVQGQGPDAVAEMQDRIMEFQQAHVLRNLGMARTLLAQGRNADAGSYLERAASFVPDFTIWETSPARMRDGSEQLAAQPMDEQTGEPRSMGFVATPQAVDQLIELFSNPQTMLANNRVARMAEERLGIALRREQRDIEREAYNRAWAQEGRTYERNVAHRNAALKRQEAQQKRLKEIDKYSFDDATKAFNATIDRYAGRNRDDPIGTIDKETERMLFGYFRKAFDRAKTRGHRMFGMAPGRIAERILDDYIADLNEELAKKTDGD